MKIASRDVTMIAIWCYSQKLQPYINFCRHSENTGNFDNDSQKSANWFFYSVVIFQRYRQYSLIGRTRSLKRRISLINISTKIKHIFARERERHDGERSPVTDVALQFRFRPAIVDKTC